MRYSKLERPLGPCLRRLPRSRAICRCRLPAPLHSNNLPVARTSPHLSLAVSSAAHAHAHAHAHPPFAASFAAAPPRAQTHGRGPCRRNHACLMMHSCTNDTFIPRVHQVRRAIVKDRAERNQACKLAGPKPYSSHGF